VEELAHGGPFVVSHDREVDRDRGDAVEGLDRVGHTGRDLVAQWAPGDRESDLHVDVTTIDDRAPVHSQIDDAAMELGILDGPEGIDNLGFGDCQHWLLRRRERTGDEDGRYFSYGHR
jgi:hypothetical protein